MRITAIAALMTVVAVAPAAGQTAGQHPYGLDPYNPHDAEILRNYASVLVAHTPLLELRKLDPYDPNHIALLRSLGGGIPLWAPWYLPGPMPALSPFPRAAGPAAAPAAVEPRPSPDPSPSAVADDAARVPPPGNVATLLRPESNDGVWIRYAGQTWLSGGAAVAFDESVFAQVGEYSGFPVYRPRGAGDDVIYLPTRQGLVAPYRLKR